MVIMSTENMSLPRYHVAGALLALNALLSPFAAEAGFDMESFRNPAPEFSVAYFWMWNDRLDPEKLCAQLDEMHSHGIRSVCVHPVPKAFRPARFTTAMDPDYLTSAYMEILKMVSGHAAKLGMNFWLYDEGGWPSGGACGLVAASDPEGRFNARTIVEQEGGMGYEVRRNPYVADGKSYPSVNEKGAAKRFLEITHERLKRHLGDEFGKSIKFAFMDEPEWPHNFRRGLHTKIACESSTTAISKADCWGRWS